jgi:glutamate-1-semialdehyde 2,1-aminomutase
MAWASSRIFRFSARRPQLSIRSQIMHVQSSQSDWITRAQAVLPAGGFGNFDPSIIIREGRGSRVWDEDGREYVDYLIGSGPMILGHGHPEVLEAVLEQLPKGMTFFANNAAGIELAEEICRAVPCAEQLRYVSTGGEADMYAMRLARAFTGRDKILKFEGGYHGMSAEAQMSLAPARLVNFPQAVPDSAGIPEAVRDGVLVAPFNDADFVRSLISEHAGQIAGIIVEPLQRLIPPAPGFSKPCGQNATGMASCSFSTRSSPGSGSPMAARRSSTASRPTSARSARSSAAALRWRQSPAGPTSWRISTRPRSGRTGFLMQLGTLSGNPVAAIAGLKTLEILRRPGAYESLRQTGQR